MTKLLVVLAALAYVLHRWVPRVQITTPVVVTVVGLILAIRTIAWLA